MPEIKQLAAPGKLLSTISKLSKVYEEKKHVLFGTEASSIQFYNANVADNIINTIRAVQSESRIFAKSISSDEEAGCSKQSAPMASNSKDDHKAPKR